MGIKEKKIGLCENLCVIVLTNGAALLIHRAWVRISVWMSCLRCSCASNHIQDMSGASRTVTRHSGSVLSEFSSKHGILFVKEFLLVEVKVSVNEV